MAIKGQLARFERHLAKLGQGIMSFVIPYCHDEKAREELERNLLIKYDLIDLRDRMAVFVIDYATSSKACVF